MLGNLEGTRGVITRDAVVLQRGSVLAAALELPFDERLAPY